MPVLLAHAIKDSANIFGISGGGLNPPNPLPPGIPLAIAIHRLASIEGSCLETDVQCGTCGVDAVDHNKVLLSPSSCVTSHELLYSLC